MTEPLTPALLIFDLDGTLIDSRLDLANAVNATRAEMGGILHLDRSTLTREVKGILSEGWAEETREGADGRSRPIVLTKAGRDLLHKAIPAWQAAQERATALLGKDGVIAISDIANRIMGPTA